MRQLKFIRLFSFLTVILFVGCTSQPEKAEEPAEGKVAGVAPEMQQEFNMTRDPQLNRVPKERLVVAKAYMENLLLNSRTAALTWEERGPNNIGGRSRAILVDKANAAGDIVFAGSVSGGLFRTTNFTNATPVWTIVNDFLPNLAITCMVQDPINLNVMYAGTGEGWFNIDAIRGMGIYKSTDGGATWNVLPSTIVTTPSDSTFEFVQDLAIDNNGSIYAALRNTTGFSRGIKRSTDGGASWTQVLGAPIPGFVTGRFADLEVASNGDVYATSGVFSKGEIWKSSFSTHGPNTGALGTWVSVTPPWVAGRHRVELAIAPSDPNRLYVFGQDSATQGQVIGLWRSTNGGAVWDSVNSPSALNNGTASQTWYNLICAVDPGNPDVLVAGGLHLAKSTNAGLNWTTISSGTVHVDHHGIIYHSASQLMNGNDGGVYYTSTIDQPAPTFLPKNGGYNVTQFYATDYHPSSVNYFLAGAQDNGTQKFVSAGMNSVSIPVGGDGGFCHIDQTDGQIQIAATTRNNYFRSLNGGATFNSLGGGINNSRGQFINPTDYDDNTNTLYCGDNANQFYVITALEGTPVGSIKSLPAMGGRTLSTVKVDPFAANTIWIGASSTGGIPMVLKVATANTTPLIINTATLGSVAGATLSSIDVDPANANHIVATLSNFGVVSVWESTNGGVSFSSIEGNLPDMPVRWAIFAPANAQLNGPSGGNGGILLGTELGVWTTSAINGSSTQWMPNNSGLANVSTHMLKLRASDNLVVAATHGRGLFTTLLPTIPTGLPNDPITKGFIKYTFAENSQLQIVVGNLQTKTMTIQLVDMSGRLVYSSQGKYQNSLVNLGKLQAGSYIVKITGNNKENFVKQFVK